MNDAERKLMVQKCSQILYLVLVDIRAMTWGWESKHQKWIEELSDLNHNLPRFILGRDDFAITGLRESFMEYSRRRWPTSDPTKTKYVVILDMDEETFSEMYLNAQWTWPEPVVSSAN